MELFPLHGYSQTNSQTRELVDWIIRKVG